MEKHKEARVVAVLALLIAIVGISVGFAAMSTTLEIQGTGEMRPVKWGVGFANLTLVSSTGGAIVEEAPVVSNTTTVIEPFAVSLTKPGSKVVYTFDIVNTGGIDATLTTFSKAVKLKCTATGIADVHDEELVCDNLVFSLKYSVGGATVGVADTLNVGVTKNVTLTIEYPISMEELPKDVILIDGLDVTMIYTQS